ncbi:MAG: hypothetical protein WKG07_46800 [Hymenobacter sp.]
MTYKGEKLYKQDFKGVFVAGAPAPLSWDFDNLRQQEKPGAARPRRRRHLRGDADAQRARPTPKPPPSSWMKALQHQRFSAVYLRLPAGRCAL